MKALIVSNGSIENYEYYRSKVRDYNFVVCADGAIRHCLELNVMPNLWIGDFDSCKFDEICNQHPELKSVETCRLKPNKDETDTHVACLKAMEKGYNNLVIWGAMGNRADHMLSNIHLLELLHSNGICAVIENENNKISYFNSHIKIKKDKKYLSLLPLDGQVVVKKTKGLLYALENFVLKREISLGVSNEIIEDYAEIFISEGSMLAIESND